VTTTSSEPVDFDLVIESGKTERHYWMDLWRFRELFYFLAWRDMLVRYKQTAVGVIWALIRPFLTMLIFTFVFSKVAKLPSGGVPYPVLVFTALLPWQFFATSVAESGGSLIANSNLISKVYFPRLVVPVSAVLTSLADFAISLVFLVLILAWYGVVPAWTSLLIPGLTLLAGAAATGIGLWLAALNVKYRDFRYIIPFIVQLGLYVSPVGFSSSIIPESWRLLYYINPMAGVIDGFRWAILGPTFPLYPAGCALSLGVIVVLTFSGVWYFRKTERAFADFI
jgi:lipopolysaccharide transport system permease protein